MSNFNRDEEALQPAESLQKTQQGGQSGWNEENDFNLNIPRYIDTTEPKKRKRGDIFDGAVLPFAAAIVERAVEDYKAALRDSKRKGRPTVEQQRLEAFFRSSWCETLTDINGEKIIQAAREREGYAI